jgi:glycosyltransferase involved in cell wall biosynthesis
LQLLTKWLWDTQDKPLEILLVLDDCPRETIEFLQEKIKSQSNEDRIKMIIGNFRGPGGARNKGIEMAKGEWILFVDSDDFLYVDSVLLALAKVPNPCEYLVGNYRTIDSVTQNQIGRTSKTANLISLAWNPGIWRILIRRNSIQRVFPEIFMGEDQVFLSGLNISSDSFIFEKTQFYDYYVNSEYQLTKSPKMRREIISAFKKTYINFASIEDEGTKFRLILLSRQMLTIMKYAKFSQKLVASSYFMIIIATLIRNSLHLMQNSRILRKFSNHAK